MSDGFAPDGSRRQVIRTVHGAKRDAQRELTRMLRDRDEGRLADGRQQLAAYLEGEWLPAVSAVSKRGRPLAPTTRQRYADAVRHVSGIIGKVRLCDLRPSHVEALRDRLLEGGRLAPQTVSDVLRVLSQALARAEARRLVGRNPADSGLVNRPAGEREPFAVIDPALGQKILAAVEGEDPWDAASHLALGLGLRREEVLGLRWPDVDEDELRVRRTLTYAAKELHHGPPKSSAGVRDLPIPGFVSRALARHRKAQADRLWPLGVRADLVVDNGIGEPWMPASFSTGWRRFAKARGFEQIIENADGSEGTRLVTFHGLRHGAATLLLAAGVPDAVAASIMGHADTRILRRYQEIVPELAKDAASRMDALLGEEGRRGNG